MVSRYTMVWIQEIQGYRRCEHPLNNHNRSSTSHNITHYALHITLHHTAWAGPDCRCHYQGCTSQVAGSVVGKIGVTLIWWPLANNMTTFGLRRGDRRYNLYRLSTALIHLRKWLLLVILPTHNHRRDSWAQFRQYLKRLSSSFTVSIHVTKHLRHKITTRDKWLGMIWAQT